jgi:lipid II:glycine glycyltransferase (peptidoglycan interpeptide bridge formation enzyme)
MQIIWNQTSRERWDAEHARHSTVMQQHWVYGASMRLPGMQTHRAEVVLNGRSVALAQFICRRYAGIFGIALCTRGPIWLGDVADADKARIQRALKQSLPMARPRIILFSPDLTDPQHPSMASLTRVLTGYSTVMLDLSQPLSALRAGLHPYWRNRLSAAERSGLKLAVLSHDSAELPRILAEEQIQRQRKRFYALPLGFIDHYLEEGGTESALILQASWQSRPVAVMLFLIHGSSATYQLGWSQAQGRALNAHNLILWNAIEQLKQRGIDKLDLGGVNTHDLPGISRFKINTGGEVITYAGGYV